MALGNRGAEALLEFIGAVARADSVEAMQERYLDGISRFIPAFAAGIYVLNPFRDPGESFAAERFAARGVSDYFLSRYEESGRSRDPVLARAVAERRAIDNRSLISAERWRTLPVYEEIFHLHRMTGLLEAPLVAGQEVIGTLNFGRHDAEAPFASRELVLAQAIAQLVGAALTSVRERDRLARERDGVLAALELCGEAVVLTDLGTNTRRMNAAARELLAHVRDDEAALEALMAAAQACRGTGRGRAAGARHLRPGEVAHHETEVTLCDGSRARLRGRSTTAEGDPLIRVCFLELLGEPGSLSLPAPAGEVLTRREREVVALAIAGLHDAEIAERLHLSTYTVKQYLRAAYAKCGVRSRVELVRHALGRPTG
jgi:DNA-binding CsgD family transcriptional regulator/GAF domain-containing protein